MKNESEGCGCSLFLYAIFGFWVLSTAVQATGAVIRAVELLFCSLVLGVESWWISLVHTPYFHLTWVVVGSLAIGFMIGWAVAFRTRLPSG